MRRRDRAPATSGWRRSRPAGWPPEFRKTSATSRLPSALSAVMLSSNRSWASGGRNPSRPSAAHAAGRPVSNPACRSADGQSWRRSIGTARTSAVGSAPSSGDRGGLEFDDLRLVDLEYRRSRRPGQSISARVEAGGQDDHLADARSRPRRRRTRRCSGCARPACRSCAACPTGRRGRRRRRSRVRRRPTG